MKGFTTFLPVETEEESIKGDEIIVFQNSQVLPMFVVHYTVSSVSLSLNIFICFFYIEIIDLSNGSTSTEPTRPKNSFEPKNEIIGEKQPIITSKEKAVFIIIIILLNLLHKLKETIVTVEEWLYS